MDELALMRSFGAERVAPSPAARAEARAALEERFAAPPTHARRSRRSFGTRRRLLAFAGATALAAVLAGVIVLSSGPTAQPAAAEVLRRTASIAATSGPATPMPGPHQLLYMKTERMELKEWNDELAASYGGVIPRLKGGFGGFVRWREEAWMSNHRQGRDRLVLQSTTFLSVAERHRWQEAGSPPPGIFGGEERPYKGAHFLDVRPGVYDVETLDGPGYGQFAGLPTEPKALRQAIESRQTKGHTGGADAAPIDTGQVIAELWEILDKANSRPALRAAVFNALAEEPGIELNRDATDMVGRKGYALSYEGTKASGYQAPGRRVEYIFDPETSAVLGRRESVSDPAKLDSTRHIPAGTVLNEVAYLGIAAVDSTHERPKAAHASGE